MTASFAKATESVAHWLFRPVSSFPFALLRVLVAGTLLIQGFLILGSVDVLYGPNGLLQESVAQFLSGMSSFRFSHWAASLGISPGTAMAGGFAAYFGLLALMLAGRGGKPVVFGVWSIHFVIFMIDGRLSSYGADTFAQILLTYLLVAPAHQHLSLGQKPGEGETHNSYNQLILRTMQIHLAIIYGSTALAKAQGAQWWNGEVIWRSVMLPQFSQFDMSWMASWPHLAAMLSVGTLTVEGLYPLGMAYRRTRFWWLTAVVCLHAGIGLFLGLVTFAMMMIIFNICAFYFEIRHDLHSAVRRSSPSPWPTDVVTP